MNNAQLLISIQVDAGVAANLVRDLIQEAKLTGRVALGAGDIAVLRAASGRLTSASCSQW
jgi:DNA helicase TIP49 (TBP-interacting protein)